MVTGKWILPCLLYMYIATVSGYLHKEELYKGHKILRITPHSEHHVKVVRNLLGLYDLDIWREAYCVFCHLDVRVSPHEFDDVTSALTTHNINASVIINDVQELLDIQKRALPDGQETGFDYSRYHSLNEIYSWLTNITEAHTDMATMFNVAYSTEGRPLLGVRISSPTLEEKPTIYLEGGIHGREWISPATVIYIIDQMLENYEKDPELTAMVDMFDWYILPVTNPDGYAYTWKSSNTRLWRKTRSLQDSVCVGVDPNRNWGMAWGEEGSSHSKCSNIFHGPYVFSEPETRGVADFLSSLDNLRVFIDFHSYGQMVLTPWGYTRDLPDDNLEQMYAAQLAVEAIEGVNGTKYRYGNHADVIYIASGISMDWVYGRLGVKYSYVVELRDTGEFAFLLPDDQILPTAIEMLEGIKAIAKYAKDH